MALIEKNIILTTKLEDGTVIVERPYTSIHNVKGGVATINGIAPSETGNINIPIVDEEEITEFINSLFEDNSGGATNE